MTQAELLPDPSVVVDDARARAFEFDATPAPVVRQWAEKIGAGSCRVFLDPAAGHGVFGMVIRELSPRSDRLAIEPREEALPDLNHHYTWSLTGRLQDLLDTVNVERCDLVGTNPPFSGPKDEKPRIGALEFIELLAPRLAPGAQLWLLQLLDFGQRSAKGRRVFSSYVPTRCLRIGRPIAFRKFGAINTVTGKPNGYDQRSYAWWCFERHNRTGATYLETLPALETEDCRWHTVPGSEWRHGIGGAA